jgi:hypothetical protein
MWFPRDSGTWSISNRRTVPAMLVISRPPFFNFFDARSASHSCPCSLNSCHSTAGNAWPGSGRFWPGTSSRTYVSGILAFTA